MNIKNMFELFDQSVVKEGKTLWSYKSYSEFENVVLLLCLLYSILFQDCSFLVSLTFFFHLLPSFCVYTLLTSLKYNLLQVFDITSLEEQLTYMLLPHPVVFD